MLTSMFSRTLSFVCRPSLFTLQFPSGIIGRPRSCTICVFSLPLFYYLFSRLMSSSWSFNIYSASTLRLWPHDIVACVCDFRQSPHSQGVLLPVPAFTRRHVHPWCFMHFDYLPLSGALLFVFACPTIFWMRASRAIP